MALASFSAVLPFYALLLRLCVRSNWQIRFVKGWTPYRMAYSPLQPILPGWL